MCLIFTCGEHTFRKEVEGFEGIVCRCYNCGNYAGSVLKSNPWFTFCFIPIVPLSIHGYEDITCRICNFQQPLAHRPDVIALSMAGMGNQECHCKIMGEHTKERRLVESQTRA